MEYKPNCYECKHRRPLAGNAHSKCMHPTIKLNGDDVPVVQFNQHGIKMDGLRGHLTSIRRGLNSAYSG